MKVLKVIEVVSSSDKSWEDATEKAFMEAAKTIKGIKSVNINNPIKQPNYDNNKNAEFRINAKISFTVES